MEGDLLHFIYETYLYKKSGLFLKSTKNYIISILENSTYSYFDKTCTCVYIGFVTREKILFPCSLRKAPK